MHFAISSIAKGMNVFVRTFVWAKHAIFTGIAALVMCIPLFLSR